MKRFSLAAVLSLLASSAIAQNLPDNSTQGSSSAGISRPAAFNSFPNIAPALFNYQRLFVPRIPTPDTAVASLSAMPNVRVSTTYSNGWGQPLQQIQRNTVFGKDLVTTSDHRQMTDKPSYLPHVVQGGARFQLSPYSDQQNYYGSLFPAEGDNAYTRASVTSDNATGTTVTEYGAGEGLTGNSRGTSLSTVYNTSGDGIRIWSLDLYDAPFSSGAYAAAQLTGTKKTGPHGSVTIEWKNKSGQTVCKQNALNGSFLTTYYVYNELGGLAFILPPKATEQIAANWWQITAPIRDSLCFSYKYDSHGRMTQKWTPGRGLDEFVYDRRNRLVYTRSPLMAQLGKWSFSVYDRMGRVRFSGFRNGFAHRVALQGFLDGATTPSGNTAVLEYWTYNECNAAPYPASLNNCDINQYNYYDDYSFESGSPLTARNFDNSSNPRVLTGGGYSPVVPTTLVNGMLTGTKTRVISPAVGMSAWMYGIIYYDAKGRVLQTQSTNPWTAGAWDVNTSEFNFSGDVTRNVLQHHGPMGPKPATQLTTTNSYNSVTGRLNAISIKADAAVPHSLSSFQYNELGQVSQKVLGGGAEIENLVYNIRGQLTDVNPGHTSGHNYPEQRFGYHLSYEFGHSQPRYDGTISGFTWRGSGRPQSYGYEYDEIGRMTAADYNEFSNPGYMGSHWNHHEIDYSVSNVTYDANGNMNSMKQRGVGVSGGVMQPVDMDRLRYDYPASSNRVAAITDSVTIDYQLRDFIDGSTGSRDYVYDADGNLSVDLNKGITNITYNELDLPVSVSTQSNGSIANVYDASGQLLQKTITFPSGSAPSTNPWVYRYIGPFVYRNDSLLYFTHQEGRARYLYDSSKFKYEYFVKDHLGNVRMTIASDVSARGTDYLATHEIASANTENLIFENIDKIRDNTNWGPGANNFSSAKLNAGVDSTRIGTAILLNVMAGDNFELAAHAYYHSADSNQTDYVDGYSMAESLLTALSGGSPGGPGGPPEGPGGPGGPGVDYGALQMLLSGGNYDPFEAIKTSVTDNTVPRAYINYMLFDEQMHLVGDQSGAVQVTSASADRWSVIGTASPINVTHNGFLLVYLSAEQIRDIFFDDFHVVHKKGRLLEENHYYPHGLTIRAGSANPVPTREGYQGKELQDELGLELYDFHARQYDPQIGRFWGVDPADQFPSGYTGMGNNPGNMIDPTGMMSFGAAANGSRSAGEMRRRDSDFEPYFASYHTEWEDLTEFRYGGGGSSADQPQQGEEAPTEVYNAATGNKLGTINDATPNVVTMIELTPGTTEAIASESIQTINSMSENMRLFFSKALVMSGESFDVVALREFYKANSKTHAKIVSALVSDKEVLRVSDMSNIRVTGQPYTLIAESLTKLGKVDGIYVPVGPVFTSSAGPDATFSNGAKGVTAHMHPVDQITTVNFLHRNASGNRQGWELNLYPQPSSSDRINASQKRIWNVIVNPSKMHFYNQGVTIPIAR